MPSKSRLVSKAFSSSGVLSTIAAENPTVDTGTTQIANVDALPTSGNETGDQLFIEATNRLYIWNGSGWYNIALINTSPTWDSGGQPSGSYVLDADSPQDPTTITLAASDPEGIPINYTYVIGGSMDSMATINQDSSVFTITPKTLAQLGEGTYTGSITFRASDGVNILPQISNFTLSFIVTIENSKHTIALFDVTNTSDNNDITDSSTNNYTITVNGNAQAGTFSPYRHGGYSTYFDGTGDWLELTGTALGNGDFTVEAWVWLDSLKDYNVIYDDRATGSSATGLALGVSSTGAPYLYTNNGFQITSSQTCTAKTWHHISLVRSSGVITIYLDGTSGGTYNSSANFTDTNLGIGIARTYTVTSQFDGYISDVRAVVGSAITPASGGPTERLTAVINTSLLTCHLPYITDGSTNNHSITKTGDVSIRPFTPYDNKEYEVADHGGSVYFDGTGDYLSLPSSTSSLYLTGAFTYECWIYPTSTSGQMYGNWNNQTGNAWAFWFNNAGWQNGIKIWFYRGNYGQNETGIGSTTEMPINCWNHFAITRDSSNNIYIFLNGKSLTLTTYNHPNLSWDSSYSFTNTDPIGIGGTSAYSSFKGHISDAKFVSGSALYTSDFTPPTAPQSSTGSTLHVKGTEASIIDKSQRSVLYSTGAVGTTASVNFAGTKAIDFSTVSNDYYIKIPSRSEGGPGFPNLFAAPCTIECWLNPQHTQAVNGLAHKIVWYIGDGNAYILFQQENTDNLRLRVRFGSTTYFNQETLNTYKLQRDTWQHVCFMSNAGATSCSLYLNGTRVMSGNLSNGLLDPSADNVYFSFGSSGPGTKPWAGYASDIKISTYNVYGSPADTTITPPTAPFLG